MRELRRSVNGIKKESSSTLRNQANESYMKLQDVASILYSIHTYVDEYDEDKAEEWYDLYLQVRDIAESVSDQTRYLK